MKSCDDCPGSTQCSGLNLHPVLVRVFDLYAAGKTDKFDILFALSEEDEAVLERYTAQVSRDCWTKAALLAIVEVVSRLGEASESAGLSSGDLADAVEARVRTARDAFARFPWKLDELVDQAPALYGLIQERCPDEALCDGMSKRAFVKMCKDIAFG